MAVLSETFAVGGLTISALSDGAALRAVGGFFDGVEPAEWVRALGLASAQETLPFNFGGFLVRGDGHTTLIDTGYGARARTMDLEGGGGMMERLEALGVRREDVDRVVHTHLHGDHVGWNLDDDRGKALTFPNATVYVSRRELEFWTGPQFDDEIRGTAPEDVRGRALQMAVTARECIDPYRAAGRVETFEGEVALSNAMTTIPTPGHTPGHTSILLASQGEHLLLIGDAAHHPIHLEHHDWIPGVDLDKAESRRSRAKIAALAADRNALVTGPHFPILTLGHVRRSEGGYRFEAVVH